VSNIAFCLCHSAGKEGKEMTELLIQWTVWFLLFVGIMGFVCYQLKVATIAEWQSLFLNCFSGLNRLFCQKYHALPATDLNLPATGAVLIAANHVSGLDPLLIAALSNRPVRFMIAREEYERWGLRWFFRYIGCIPVDRGARPEIALRAALRALEAGDVVALFPQGQFVLPEATSKPLRRGILWLSHHGNCPIYPVHLSGIKGIGHTMPALWMRSRVQLKIFSPWQCTTIQATCLQHLQQQIEDRIEC
jgi:1-acyl-sn-glycerol-3-phosphate acyltransferase